MEDITSRGHKGVLYQITGFHLRGLSGLNGGFCHQIMVKLHVNPKVPPGKSLDFGADLQTCQMHTAIPSIELRFIPSSYPNMFEHGQHMVPHPI